MQATKQQQIVGYFIEEANEHLDTIEQGLLELQATLADAERMNELFRAAHSVKGGAAMLGFTGIQKISHHLEDCFKHLKERPVPVTPTIEELFFQGFDRLKELVQGIQSPYGMSDQEVIQILKAVEPTFAKLEGILTGKSAPAAKAPAKDPKAVLNAALRKMLELFKQGDNPTSRQQLQTLCAKLPQLDPTPAWAALLNTAQKAIANPKASYQVLAPLVIKDIKQAGELLTQGKAEAIQASPNLQKLAGLAAAPGANRAATNGAAANGAATNGAARATHGAAKPLEANGANSREAPRAEGVRAMVSIPKEPRAAARVLLETFNKNQLIELAEYVMKAIQ